METNKQPFHLRQSYLIHYRMTAKGLSYRLNIQNGRPTRNWAREKARIKYMLSSLLATSKRYPALPLWDNDMTRGIWDAVLDSLN